MGVARDRCAHSRRDGAVFDDDRAVVAALLCEAAGLGAHSFVSDIEVASPTRSGPQYRYWNELGFEAVYLRRVFAKSNGVRAA